MKELNPFDEQRNREDARRPRSHSRGGMDCQARRMKPSRVALDRFLALGKASIALQTLSKATRAIGRDLRTNGSECDTSS